MSTLGHKTLHFFGVLAFSGQALAASYILPEKSSFMGPEGLALGGALVATKNRSDFLHSNPASPAFEKRYSLGARYSSAGDLLGAHIVDTNSSALGGAVSFHRRELKDVASAEDVSLGSFNRLENQAAISLMTQVVDNVAIGVTARYYYMRPSTAGLPTQANWSGDIGILVELSSQWRLGLVGQDLLADDAGFLYRSFALGLSGELSSQLSLMTQVDFVREPEGNIDTGFVKDSPASNFRAGLEFDINPLVLIRASYSTLSSWDASYVGFGLAYKKDKFALDYGLRVNPDSSKSLIHAFSVSVDI